MNWERYPNFSEVEFRCSHCGLVRMEARFMDRLQRLRTAYNRSMRITSGYRCALHPVEIEKEIPGAHTTGCAADIAVEGNDAYELLRLAFQMGFTGIGVQQKGSRRFIHLDVLQNPPRPNVWSY